MAVTKDSPAPRDLPPHPHRTHNRNRDRPTYNDALVDFPFATIDYFITLNRELKELFQEVRPCLWHWILAYSMFMAARMCWLYNQEDWLTLVYAVRRMVDVMGNFCVVRG